jgi:hypothetical protein
MARVARAGGTVAVQAWDLLEAQPGYGAMYAAFARHLGAEATELGGTLWALGDLELLGSLFEAAGLTVTGTRTRMGAAQFPSAADAVATELDATPLAAGIDQDTRRRRDRRRRPGHGPVRGRRRPGRAAHRRPPGHRGRARLNPAPGRGGAPAPDGAGSPGGRDTWEPPWT